ncbi:MAG TPA: signal recognition particle-docking protein FtsY [Acidimicrobiales bacterium]
MDPVLLVVVVLVVLVVGLVGVRRSRRSSGGLDLESPPIKRDSAIEVEDTEALTATAPVTPLTPVAPRFRGRIGKARQLVGGYLSSVLSRSVDNETWEELTEALIRADVGVETSTQLIGRLRQRAEAHGITESAELVAALKADLVEALDVGDRTLRFSDDPSKQTVWLFVGVNGVGKTTSIGKVAHHQRSEGRTTMMAAGDTFRAAAAEQLTMWADRTGAQVVSGREGGDPAAVIYDAISAAHNRGLDLVLADTAGRLHTKSNLMDELAKVRRVADKEPGHVTEVLLVLDAATGQNGLVQAKEFTQATDVTGIVLTKLDGTPKGGITLAIETTLGIPVKLVGLGEGADDLVAFDPAEFVDALFDPPG